MPIDKDKNKENTDSNENKKQGEPHLSKAIEKESQKEGPSSMKKIASVDTHTEKSLTKLNTATEDYAID